MKGRPLGLALGIAALALELAAHPVFAAIRSPEQDTLAISKLLKPISDEEWGTLAGGRLGEKYSIIKGDTLYDISKRLFGDPRYWPKLYALNNDSITNPHLIRPGNTVSFMPGTGTSLPSVSVQAGGGGSTGSAAGNDGFVPPLEAADTQFSGKGPRSQEWRDLPKQAWEATSNALPPNVDTLGFDKDSRINFSKPKGFEVEAIPGSERLLTLGQIIGSRTGAAYLSTGDTVYIRAEEDMQLGETYAVTEEPSTLKSRKSDRVGYSYPILGKVKIIGVRDNLFIGTMITSRTFLARGAVLIPLPPRVPELTPIPGPSPVEGVLMMDRKFSTYTVAQHKQVYIDRGSDDGIAPGMVFRAYQHYDLSNEKRITSSDFIIDADMMVVHVAEKFCAAVVIKSISPITEGSTVVLLTDVSDLERNRGFTEKTVDGQTAEESELDELDRLDGGEGLGTDEKRELEQLEKWKGNPPAPELGESAPGGDADISRLPPPPDDGLPPADGTPPPEEPVPDADLPPTADLPGPVEGEAAPPGGESSLLPEVAHPPAPSAPPEEPAPDADSDLPPPPPGDAPNPDDLTPPPTDGGPPPAGESAFPAEPEAVPPPPPPAKPAPRAPAPEDDDSAALDRLLNQ